MVSRVNHSHCSAADKTIYIIDPDASARQSLECALTPTFRHVKTFDDAEPFLAQCESIQQGCLITSVLLPGTSVPELIDRLKSEVIRLPVIVLGDDSKMSLAVSIMRAGAADFIEKPFSEHRLKEAIRRVLE